MSKHDIRATIPSPLIRDDDAPVAHQLFRKNILTRPAIVTHAHL
jgi:hypothetical protein